MTLAEPTSVGVIIGRFQVPKLHGGHSHLFDLVLRRHKRVLVLLAIPAWKGGIKNPLDYQTRKQMIESVYPEAFVAYIKDRQTNEDWSKDIDDTIRDIFPLEKITLYGGRSGFIPFYSGQFETVQTVEDPIYDTESGTILRESAASLPRDSEDFRAGVIYATFAQPDGICMCVDAAITRVSNFTTGAVEVLLIRKPMEKKWRFPGGRVDRGDASLETAVGREVREETGVEVGKPSYIGSGGPIPDWRSQQVGIAIYSAFYHLPYIYGHAKGGDDAAEAQWFSLFPLKQEAMELCHQQYLVMLQWWASKNLISPKEVEV